ncbi:NAD(P)/FAD-dependent oxidoreductase [Adhaeribacter radiodurans]|uniref:NAD(P)/FAD-dependent oxidoreductase n=1 Tax=Adhaeribacter radiodurans TaxID=2745197 RepID=A0A7L7LE95_9BACT|nr:FAD/NAD(P)-binding oxidoreductase [Adhaeribacter radiodurans]QMU31141.1 NAD(P)/FAD-dependent oxidoreductase [Adhaeribacter radiodurans]
MKKIVIIGNGIAGITLAQHVRRLSDHSLLIISSETDYFFSRTALMYVYMGHLRADQTKPFEDWYWPENRIELKRDYVTQVDTSQKQLQLQSGEIATYDILVIASGSKSNTFSWPGQDLAGVQGLYSWQDLENLEVLTSRIKRAVIVGGGLIGVELAEMFLSRCLDVTFLVREKSFWSSVLPTEESAMVTRHIQSHHVDLRLETELAQILPDETGHVRAVITKKGEEIPCQFVGLAVGVHPNVDFLRDSGIALDKGVLVNKYFETNVPDVYAIGDCAQYLNPPVGRKPVEPLWYAGRMHGETLAHTLCSQQTAYKPGMWFNSAKFFDIEYQVYGEVNQHPQPGEEHIYWEHPNGKKSIRICFDKASNRVKGFNLMGIRYRHEVCERWIRNNTPIQEVLKNLREANFDPEFYKRYEPELLRQYNQLYPAQKVTTSKLKQILGFKR